MSVSDFLWSERARSEFAALFDDAAYSDAFRKAVSDALVRGWSNNRDKPFWALSVLVVALAASGGSEDGMDVVWQSPADVRIQLSGLEEDSLSAFDCEVREDDGTLLLITPDGDFRLTNHRLRVLRKLAEFFLCCDEFAHAPEIMALLARLATSGTQGNGTYADVKEATREFARVGYRFRTDNFLDGHATSAFSVINSYLASRDYVLVDDTIFEFWADRDNERYKTYEATYQAFANYAAAMDDARATNAGANAHDIADPALTGAIAGIVANDETPWGADDDGDPDDPSQEIGDTLGGEDALDEVVEEKPADPTVLGDASLRLFGHKEITLLSRLTEIQNFAPNQRIASLRLIAFHPVQSGISNGLRTGKWKIPLSERVTCEEAKSYVTIIDDLETVRERAVSWLEVAFALASNDGRATGAAAEAREAGLATLAKSRSKALQQDPETLRMAFLQVTPALIQARELADRFAGLFRRALATSPAADVDENAQDTQFSSDKALFAAEFIRRYLDVDDNAASTAASTIADAASAETVAVAPSHEKGSSVS
ncbi:MAG: hypothetical protein AAFZ01_10720 [Pseudomonadota bacterium]